jgi:hypothetical protein
VDFSGEQIPGGTPENSFQETFLIQKRFKETLLFRRASKRPPGGTYTWYPGDPPPQKKKEERCELILHLTRKRLLTESPISGFLNILLNMYICLTYNEEINRLLLSNVVLVWLICNPRGKNTISTFFFKTPMTYL